VPCDNERVSSRTSIRLIAERTGGVVRLTGRAMWHGLVSIYHSDDLTYAASVGFYGLVSLFPFMLMVLSIVGTATADESRRMAVVDFIFTYFPRRFDFLTHQIDVLRQSRVQLGIGGTLGLVWAAMGVFSAVTSAVNHAWGVEKQRSYLRHKFFAFLMLLTSGALLLAVLLIVSMVQIARASWFPAMAVHFPMLQSLTGMLLRWATLAMLILVVGFIFYFVPNAEVKFKDVWAGAIVTGVMLKTAMAAFSWYVRDMSRYTEINGSIAAVVVFLVWVYTSAVILLYGVEMTAAYARLRSGRSDDAPAAPSPRR
jgi:membrane protein